MNALGGAADPFGLGVVSGQLLAQYFWAETRDINISPREGKLPGGYFDRGEFFFRVMLDHRLLHLLDRRRYTKSHPIFFDWDKVDVTPEAMQMLEAAAADYKATKPGRIKVVGYDDLSGSPEHAQLISERRASAVDTVLQRLGVTPWRSSDFFSWTK